MSGYFASGLLLLALGIPCIVLGMHLRRAPAVSMAKKGKGKGKGSKRRPGSDAQGQASGGMSLVLGGAAFALCGVAFIAYELTR